MRGPRLSAQRPLDVGGLVALHGRDLPRPVGHEVGREPETDLAEEPAARPREPLAEQAAKTLGVGLGQVRDHHPGDHPGDLARRPCAAHRSVLALRHSAARARRYSSFATDNRLPRSREAFARASGTGGTPSALGEEASISQYAAWRTARLREQGFEPVASWFCQVTRFGSWTEAKARAAEWRRASTER